MNVFPEDFLVKLPTVCRGRVPYGYQLGKDGKKLVEHGQEQCIIADIIGRHANGDSIRKIARDLAQLGIVSRAGKPFGNTQIHRIIKLFRQKYYYRLICGHDVSYRQDP